MNFEYFEIQKCMSQTVRVEKSKWKKWGRQSNFHVPFKSYGP